MTGFIVSVSPFRNRVSPTEAFGGLELGEGNPSRPVLRGPGGRKAPWLLGSYQLAGWVSTENALVSIDGVGPGLFDKASDKPEWCGRVLG
jgi:hypothetical protein